MNKELVHDYLSAEAAAERLNVSVRRIYDLIKADRLQARHFEGRHLIDAGSVEARRRSNIGAGRPFSAQRAWALILLAENGDVAELDSSSKSKLRGRNSAPERRGSIFGLTLRT